VDWIVVIIEQISTMRLSTCKIKQKSCQQSEKLDSLICVPHVKPLRTLEEDVFDFAMFAELACVSNYGLKIVIRKFGVVDG